MSSVPSILENQKLYSFNEVAEALGVHPVTVRNYSRLGKISHYKIGGQVRFTEKQITDFIKICEVPAQSDL